MSPTKPRIAFVYDWLTTQHGGAEVMIRALHQLYPDAEWFTSVQSNQVLSQLNLQSTPSFLQKIYPFQDHHRWCLPFLPLAFESFDLTHFDIVISLTSFAAKGIITKPDQLHLSFILTPPRFLYHQKQTYWSKSASWFFSPVIKYLLKWDQAASKRPDQTIAISQRVQARIKSTYGLQSQVIYPPHDWGDTSYNRQSAINNQQYLLVVSRLVKYKKVENVIKACARLGKHLVIVGEGPEYRKLKSLVGTSELVTFKKNQTRQELATLYRGCRAVVMPEEEDFGIVGLEAMFFQKPLTCHQKSGVAELLQPHKNSLLLPDSSVSAISHAIRELEKTQFESDTMKAIASANNRVAFQKKVKSLVEVTWQSHNQKGRHHVVS